MLRLVCASAAFLGTTLRNASSGGSQLERWSLLGAASLAVLATGNITRLLLKQRSIARAQAILNRLLTHRRAGAARPFAPGGGDRPHPGVLAARARAVGAP